MFRKKSCSEKFREFPRKKYLCWFLLLIKLQAFRPLCKDCCALAILKNVYTNKADLFFCFVFISSIESDENLPTCFFKIFFHIFYNFVCAFSRRKILHKTKSSHARLFLNMYNKTFFQKSKYRLLH